MPSRKVKRTELSSGFNGSAGLARHFPALGILAQVVQAGVGLLMVPAQLMTQCGEGLARLAVGQRLGPLIKEKRATLGLGKGLGASP